MTYKEIIKEIEHISAIHCKEGWRHTTEREQTVIDAIDALIAEGDVQLYVAKALLHGSNNWSTFELMRPGLFKDILLEGIEKGTLGPECKTAWEWMEIASFNNDPEEFMHDMERYYDILATAAEDGRTEALDIMYTIWEPENCQEED